MPFNSKNPLHWLVLTLALSSRAENLPSNRIINPKSHNLSYDPVVPSISPQDTHTQTPDATQFMSRYTQYVLSEPFPEPDQFSLKIEQIWKKGIPPIEQVSLKLKIFELQTEIDYLEIKKDRCEDDDLQQLSRYYLLQAYHLLQLMEIIDSFKALGMAFFYDENIASLSEWQFLGNKIYHYFSETQIDTEYKSAHYGKAPIPFIQHTINTIELIQHGLLSVYLDPIIDFPIVEISSILYQKIVMGPQRNLEVIYTSKIGEYHPIPQFVLARLFPPRPGLYAQLHEVIDRVLPPLEPIEDPDLRRLIEQLPSTHQNRLFNRHIPQRKPQTQSLPHSTTTECAQHRSSLPPLQTQYHSTHPKALITRSENGISQNILIVFFIIFISILFTSFINTIKFFSNNKKEEQNWIQSVIMTLNTYTNQLFPNTYWQHLGHNEFVLTMPFVDKLSLGLFKNIRQAKLLQATEINAIIIDPKKLFSRLTDAFIQRYGRSRVQKSKNQLRLQIFSSIELRPPHLIQMMKQLLFESSEYERVIKDQQLKKQINQKNSEIRTLEKNIVNILMGTKEQYQKLFERHQSELNHLKQQMACHVLVENCLRVLNDITQLETRVMKDINEYLARPRVPLINSIDEETLKKQQKVISDLENKLTHIQEVLETQKKHQVEKEKALNKLYAAMQAEEQAATEREEELAQKRKEAMQIFREISDKLYLYQNETEEIKRNEILQQNTKITAIIALLRKRLSEIETHFAFFSCANDLYNIDEPQEIATLSKNLENLHKVFLYQCTPLYQQLKRIIADVEEENQRLHQEQELDQTTEQEPNHPHETGTFFSRHTIDPRFHEDDSTLENGSTHKPTFSQ